MSWDAQSILGWVTALGVGGIISAIINYFKDRKKNNSDSSKTDLDVKLTYLNTVIERLDADNDRLREDRDRIQGDLTMEQDRNATLRRRVRELEEEIDGVRRSARETQHKCDELATRLEELVADTQEK